MSWPFILSAPSLYNLEKPNSQYSLSIQNMLPQTPSWKTIPSSTQPRPSVRWGHSSCIVNQDLYIFGGFANSTYMNDLWKYDITRQQWQQIHTLGDVPEQRSNATLNYDPTNNQLLLFGGGGPNKKRYNCVNILDINTMNWIEISPYENQNAPWERTYHIAEFKYPYLVVFGGQAADDLGDLWVYDVRYLTWQEVRIEHQKDRPCARRFHSSCLVGTTLYVFGGCHSKYVCLNDLYSLDLTPLLQSQQSSIPCLQWQILTPSQGVLERWGHSLSHYNNHLYIFGGRSQCDLNDLISINLATMQTSQVQTQQQPSARRRHGGGFIGSCLVLFGGFDGNYYDDLFYINLYQEKKNKIRTNMKIQQITTCQPREYIFDSCDERFAIHSCLVGKYFSNQAQMQQFLATINKKYSKEELETIFETLYRGWGELPLNNQHLDVMKAVPKEQQQSIQQLVLGFMERNSLCRMSQEQKEEEEKEGEMKYCVELPEEDMGEYLMLLESHWQMDRMIVLNNQLCFNVSHQLLSLHSQYFLSLFSSHYKFISNPIQISLPIDPLSFDLTLAYLHTNILVLPLKPPISLLQSMASLAHYLSLSRLLQLCQQLLCSAINHETHLNLTSIARQMLMDQLEQKCAIHTLKNYYLQPTSKGGNTKKQQITGKARQLEEVMRFDLVHQKKMRQNRPMKEIVEGQEEIEQKSGKDKENKGGMNVARKSSS